MHVMSANLTKTFVCKREYDLTNSVCPVTMTTIRHCSILEFGRGACNQALAPGITRPLHATDYAQGPNIQHYAMFHFDDPGRAKLPVLMCMNNDLVCYCIISSIVIPRTVSLIAVGLVSLEVSHAWEEFCQQYCEVDKHLLFQLSWRTQSGKILK